MRLENDGVPILGSMIRMEQLLTKGLKCLDNNLASDDHMRNLRISVVFISCIDGFQTNESQELCGVDWQRVTDDVHDNDKDEYPSYLSHRIYISIADSHKSDKHEIDGCAEDILISAILVNIEILYDHKENRRCENHYKHFDTKHLHLDGDIVVLVHLLGVQEYLDLGDPNHPGYGQEQEALPA